MRMIARMPFPPSTRQLEEVWSTLLRHFPGVSPGQPRHPLSARRAAIGTNQLAGYGRVDWISGATFASLSRPRHAAFPQKSVANMTLRDTRMPSH